MAVLRRIYGGKAKIRGTDKSQMEVYFLFAIKNSESRPFMRNSSTNVQTFSKSISREENFQ